MNKKVYIGGVTLATLMFFSSCSNSTGNRQESTKTITKDSVMLPRTATDGQVYRDNNGNNWMFNAMMGYWIMSSFDRNSGRENHYYYYPSTGKYQDGSGSVVVPPASVTSGVTTKKTVTVPVSKTTSSSVSSSSSSKSSSVRASKPSTPSSKSSVFGSTGRSFSIGS